MAIKTEITSNTMYERYKNRLILRVVQLKQTIISFQEVLGTIDIDLEKRKLILDKYCNYTLRELKTKRHETVTRFMKYDKYDDAAEIMLIAQLIKDRINTLNIIERAENELQILQQFTISKEVFKYVLKQYNTKMITHLIEDGYTWKLGTGLGTLNVVVQSRTTPSNGMLPINWKETKEEKEKLINEGVELFNMEYNPEGQEYLRFFTEPFSLWIYWNKNMVNTMNASYYAFRPVKGENNIISKMQQYWRAKPEVLRKYVHK